MWLCYVYIERQCCTKSEPSPRYEMRWGPEEKHRFVQRQCLSAALIAKVHRTSGQVALLWSSLHRCSQPRHFLRAILVSLPLAQAACLLHMCSNTPSPINSLAGRPNSIHATNQIHQLSKYPKYLQMSSPSYCESCWSILDPPTRKAQTSEVDGWVGGLVKTWTFTWSWVTVSIGCLLKSVMKSSILLGTK